MSEHIREFSGQYRFLSNFFIEPDGTHVEGEYQAHKTNPPDLNLTRMSPSKAKAVGQRVKLRPDWDEVKISIMTTLVGQKFRDHEELRRLLLATGDAYLEEGNTWGDDFWGTVNGLGHNHLGRILMFGRGVEIARGELT